MNKYNFIIYVTVHNVHTYHMWNIALLTERVIWYLARVSIFLHRELAPKCRSTGNIGFTGREIRKTRGVLNKSSLYLQHKFGRALASVALLNTLLLQYMSSFFFTSNKSVLKIFDTSSLAGPLISKSMVCLHLKLLNGVSRLISTWIKEDWTVMVILGYTCNMYFLKIKSFILTYSNMFI